MKPVKKLRHILEDTLGLLAELEQHNRNVLIQFTCYRNNRIVHKSSPIKRGQLSAKLPEACRQHRATELSLLITGTNRQLQPAELYRADFVLGSKEPAHASYQKRGLGGLDSESMVAETWSDSGRGIGGGLGALDEAVEVANHLLAEGRFMDKHEALQQEAAELRKKVKELEDELAKEREALSARDLFKERIEQFTPFMPLLTQLVGVNSPVGRALSGLGSIGSNNQIEAAGTVPDDAHTTAVLGVVRGFMGTLHESYKGQLVFVMQRVQKDPNLIPHLARFIQTPPPANPAPPPATQQNPTHQPTEQKQKQKQDAAQPDSGREKV